MMRLGNTSTASNTTDTKQNLDFCHPFVRANFEIVITVIPLAVNAALNVLLAIAATLTNLLVFIAVRRNTSIRFPSKLLLYSLILTDLGTGAVVQPQFVAILLAKATNSPDVTCPILRSFYFAVSLFSSASLWTMTAISLDRYIAFFFHLRYNEIVTTKRIYMVLVLSWSFSLFFTLVLEWNTTLYSYILLCCLSICLFVITVSYIRIYRGLRGHHGDQFRDQAQVGAQVQAQRPAENTVNVAKYRQTASSMMWIYGLFLFCYLPNLLVRVVDKFIPYNFLMMCIFDFTLTLVLLNSSLNPIVYCFRLPEIRAEVIRTLRKICHQSS